MKVSSFSIAVMNYISAAVLFVLAKMDVLGTYRLINLVLFPIYLYFIFSVAFAIIGVYFGANGIKSKNHVPLNTFSILSNAVYLLLYIWGVVLLWPALMGV